MLQPKIKAVQPLPDYRLLLEYENGEKRVFDVTPYISGSCYGELKDENIFRAVRPCGSTVEWAGGQDIAPHELYEMSIPCS